MKLNGKYGVLNIRGIFIIEPAYEYLKIVIPESETSVQDPSRLIFSKYGIYGVMDFSGKVLLNPVYDLIQPVKRLFLVKKSGLSGVISEKGKVYLPIIYPAIKVFDAGIYTIQKEGKEYLIDFYGNKQLKD